MTADRSEALFLVQEAIRRLQGEGRPVDETALAQEFDVSPAEVQQCRAALALLEPALPPPRLPDDYEVRGEVGRGGMGVVYRARQRSLDREVAVKVLRSGDVSGGNFIERFRKEARSLARLRHPHIVAIHEVGETDGCLFYSMDLIAGASLAELIARGEVTPARAVRVLRQVASAIVYSHSHGVIHRDLKPANILINAEGDAFVADFGLARDLSARTDLTASGQILGTPAYMSPEQARGDAARIGERSDVYALGAILYECLTGRAPFAGLGLAEMVYAVVHEEPKRPRRVNPLAPRELEVICGKAMAKRQEDRYATANALLEDLERFHEGRPLLARPPTLRYRVGRLLARQRRALAVGGAVAAVVLGVFFGIVLPRLRPPAAATVAAAQDLLRAGEPAAALVLAEKAASQPGHERAHAVITSTTLAAFLALVRALPTQLDATSVATGLAHLQRARDLAVASQDAADGDALLATAWPFAGKAAAVGAFEAVDAVGETVERVLAARRLAAQPSLVGMLAFAIGGTPAPGKDVLAFLEPALRAPADPLRLVAARIVSNLVTARPDGELASVFAVRVAHEPALLIPILELLDHLDTRGAAAATALFVKEREPGPLASALAPATDVLLALARHGTGRAQAVAAELIAVGRDLPLRMRRDGADLLVPDAARAAAIAHLAAEVASLSRREDHRRRVAAAIAALDAAAGEELSFVTGWLAEHTQADHAPASPPDRQVAAWRQWWSAHQADDPRAWFVATLGLERLPEPEDAPALLVRYLRAPYPERAACHFLLSLVATPRAGYSLPHRSWPGVEPEDLPMAWYSALTAPDAGPQFCLRVACLRWLDGEAAPTVAFEERFVLRVGDRVELRREGNLPAAPVSCESPRVPGVQPPAVAAAGTWRVQVEPVRLIWTRLGRVRLVVDRGDVSWGAMHPHVGGSTYTSGMPDVDEGEVAVLLRHELPGWAGGGVGGEQLVGATFEAGDGEPRAWTVADWRAALAETCAGLATDFWVASTGGLDWDRLYRAQRATEAATWLPVSEAAEDLARLTVTVPNHQVRGSDGFSRNVTRARLLSGDATALDGPDFEARVPVVAEDDSDAARDTRFWGRVWLASTDARLRGLAARRMHAALLPAATAAAMAVGDREGEDALPPALAAVVANGAAMNWRARFLPDLGILAASSAAVLVALAAACAFLWASRARTTGLLLLVAGLLVVTFDVRVHGVNLLPDAGGAAFAAAGVWLLARGGRGHWRWLPLGFLSAAAVLGGLFEANVAPFTFSPALTVALALAVLSLPCVAFACPPRSPRGRWVSAVLTLVVAGAFGARAGLVLFNDIGARLVFGMPGRVVFGGPSWAGLQQEWLPLVGMVAALVLVWVRARRP